MTSAVGAGAQQRHAVPHDAAYAARTARRGKRRSGPYGAEDVTNAPNKIHLATRAYLAAWAGSDGRLVERNTRFGTCKPKAPAAVGWRPQWWGVDNPSLNRACEEACGKLETVAPRLINRLEHMWPLSGDQRAILAQFMALHVLRTPAFVQWFARMREKSLLELGADWDQTLPFADFERVMRSDDERARKLLKLTNKLSSTFASMHWSLICFEENLLATGDQPVCGVPLPSDELLRPVSATVDDGWSNTLEVRFAATPRLLVVGSWHDGPETGPGSGHWLHAVDHNVAVSTQADRQWFHHPDRLPAMPPQIFAHPSRYDCSSIAQAALPGYTAETARRSVRRRQAVDEVNRLIKKQDDRTIRFVTVDARAA